MAKMLTVEEVAALLRVSKQTVWKRIRAGEIPAVKPGQRYLVNEDDLRAILAKPKA